MDVIPSQPPARKTRLKNALLVGLLWAFLYSVATYVCFILPAAAKPGLCNPIADFGSLPGLLLIRSLESLPPHAVILVTYLGSILFWLIVGTAAGIFARRLWLAVVMAVGISLVAVFGLIAIMQALIR